MEDDIYVLQHFGFTAIQVSLERKHLLQTLLYTAFESMIKKVTTSADTRNLLNLKKDEIVQKMLESMEPELNELSALDNKNFYIPDHVLLADDFDHIENYTEEQEKEIDEEIAKYKQLFLENNVMIKSLEEQEEQFEMCKPYFEQYLGTREKVKTAIDLLNNNKLSHIQNFVRATKHVVGKLQNVD